MAQQREKPIAPGTIIQQRAAALAERIEAQAARLAGLDRHQIAHLVRAELLDVAGEVRRIMETRHDDG